MADNKTGSMQDSTSLRIQELKCNYLTDPLGVEASLPLLSWVLYSEERGQCQTAYRIIAAGTLEQLCEGKPDLWDSGKVEGDCSVQVKYQGTKLKSRQACYWKVCVWDRDGRVSNWSDTAFFEMGLLEETEWKAKWICATDLRVDLTPHLPAPLLRKPVILEKNVARARAYICGIGYHEFYINGQKIGDQLLSPAPTQYDKAALYNTYDITNALVKGSNAIGVILGNGWYNCFTKDPWYFREAPWRQPPKLLFQAYVLFEDGEEIVITSDSTWKVSTGPIIFDGLRNGEFYDARLEKHGWNEAAYDSSGWAGALIAKSPGGALRSFQMSPVKLTGTIEPVGLKEVKPGVWVYDLGQNISGWAQLKVCGPAGTEVTLKYAEKLKADGSIDTSNIDVFIYSGEFQTDKYILMGEGTEVWEPRFTYHGFQYVEVSGFPGTPTLESLRGRIVHTALEARGSFECSNELLNSIQKCALRSTLYNYHGIPTDCPHREKNGWTGDASLSAEQVLMNFEPVAAYSKWMRDFKDVQRRSGQLPGIVPTGGWGFDWGGGPAWDSAMILIPWYIYLYRGDISVCEEMYDNMKRYLDFLHTASEDYIVGYSLGDWCPPLGGPDEYKCPNTVTDTAYYFVFAATVSKIGELLNKKEESEKYAALANNIRDSFRRHFFNPGSGTVTSDCQTAYACVLYQGLTDENEKNRILKRLVEKVELENRHTDCGILGTKYLLHSLTELGRADLAYAIATQTTFPSWGYWIMQGATTLWERWDGDASRCHHMYSDISAWLYKGIAGINPDPEEPGFKHIILRPNPVDGLDWVKAAHHSMYGRITCNWRAFAGELNIQVEVPVSCHATLYLPPKYPCFFAEGSSQAGEGTGIEAFTDNNGLTALVLTSGKYSIVSREKK